MTLKRLMILGTFGVTALWLGIGHAAGWSKINSQAGVTVWTKPIAGSAIKAVKGVTVIHAPIEKIFYVLRSTHRRKEWAKYLEASWFLERTNGGFSFVVYQKFALPWPASNRDVVLKGHAFRDGKGDVHLAVKSVRHPKAPKTVGVRSVIHYGHYVMTPLGKNSTRVKVELHAEPRGWFPNWLVNRMQKNWPIKTLTALRFQVRKAYVKMAPLPAAK